MSSHGCFTCFNCVVPHCPLCLPCDLLKESADRARLPQPALRIVMYTLPSWNDFLGISRHSGAAQGMMQTWRKKGEKAALQQVTAYGGNVTRWEESGVSDTGRITKTKHARIAPVFFDCQVRLDITFWRATKARYDIFSPMIKPVVDGFVDAGLLPDDSYLYIPFGSINFGGIDETLKPSKEDRERRKNIRAGRKTSLPMPTLYHFPHG